jgi:glycosyltransferase involved in cell wall biosynthesis
MAAGAPVIALAKGGSLDSVRCLNRGTSHPTGLLFPDPTTASLVEAVEHFEQGQLWKRLPAEGQRAWANQFSPQRFRRRLLALIERYWQSHRARQERDRSALPFPLP